jgi:hypothetical protein
MPELELSHLEKESIFSDDPFLVALAEREEANREGKLMVISLLIHCHN